MTGQSNSPEDTRRPTQKDGIGEAVRSDTTSPTHISDAHAAPSKQKKSRERGPKYDTFEALVRQLYSRKGGAVSLTRKDAKHLDKKALPEDFVEVVLKPLAKSDRTTAVPAQLFLLGLPHRRTITNRFWNNIVTIYISMFQSCYPGLSPLFKSLDETRRLETHDCEALRKAAKPGYVDSLPDLKCDENITPAAKKHLEHNILCNVVLWLCELCSVDMHLLVRYLHEYRWAQAANTKHTSVEKLKLLFTLSDHAAAGIATTAFSEEVDNQARIANDAIRKNSLLTSDLASSQEAVIALEARVESLSAELEALRDELTLAKQQHKADVAHAQNNLEQLRAGVVRRIEDEVDLLREGLSALRRDPPRTHVMEDHAERAIAGLNVELKKMTGRNAP